MDKIFTAVCVAATIVLVVFNHQGGANSAEILAAWLLAFLNHILDSGILAYLDRVKIDKRLKTWLILTTVKFAMLLAGVAMILLKTGCEPIPFIYTFLIAYFFFFIYHVAKLYRKFLSP